MVLEKYAIRYYSVLIYSWESIPAIILSKASVSIL
jgi:hypothetical protein